jgi:hypothetical protein
LAQHQGFDRANRVEQVLRCRPGIGTRLRRCENPRGDPQPRLFHINRISMGFGDKALDFALAQNLSRITEANNPTLLAQLDC